MKRLLFLLIFLIQLFSILSAQSLHLHHSKTDIYCKECHTCNKPTEKEPCLKCCPEFTRKDVVVRYSIDKAPEVITIDVISDQYGASVFSHRLHAEMADMSGGCSLCHHHNPPGQIASCQDCHKANRKRLNLRKPDLKAAYHRQCLGCHLEWKHENDCIKCHALKEEKREKGEKELDEEQNIQAKINELKDKKHPQICSPVKKVYNTEYDEGKIVTFYHDDHVRMYNFNCIDCHQDEKCAACHDLTGKAASKEKEPHENCSSCHENDIDENCIKCHDTKEREPFNHSSTGWQLKSYHKKLKCQSCHSNNKKFVKLNNSCKSCHKNWNPGNFNHELTGMVLDENHEEQDCESCHTNQNFQKKPDCSECHEDITYPKYKPGKVISIK